MFLVAEVVRLQTSDPKRLNSHEFSYEKSALHLRKAVNATLTRYKSSKTLARSTAEEGVGLNVLLELDSLTQLFPEGPPLVSHAEHIPSASTPEPYKSLLVHSHHMTVTMESHHGCSVDVRVLQELRDGEDYCRKILLLKSGTQTVVQFGIVRLHLQFVSEAVRDEILAGKIPLGRVLINHNVLRQIDLGAILKITPGPQLQEYFQCGPEDVVYGRLATIFCDERPAIDLLEVSAPLS